MNMSRIAAITTAAAIATVMSTSAFAVSSESECIAKEGTVMDLQNVKHCLVPVIPEEFQGEEYATEILGVNNCSGALRKTSIGDFCLVALEAKPAPVSMAAAEMATAQANEAAQASIEQASSEQINTAIADVASETQSEAEAETAPQAEKPKKRFGFFGSKDK